jgi:hypothetical protein
MKVAPGKMIVEAVEGSNVPMVTGDGATVMGRYVGIARDGSKLGHAEVNADAYHVRAMNRGALRLLASAGEEWPPAEAAGSPAGAPGEVPAEELPAAPPAAAGKARKGGTEKGA